MEIYFDLTDDRWSKVINAGRKNMEINPQDWETAVMMG